MRTWAKGTARAALLTAGFVAFGSAGFIPPTAFADTSGNQSVLGGNQLNVPINAPIDISGNALAVFGRAQAASQGGAAVLGGGAGSGVHQRTSGNGSIGGGNQVNAPINAPVNVCGNAIAVVGGAVAGCEGGAAVAGGGAGSGVHQRTSGNGSVLGGNQVNAPINAPVNVCGNAIAVLGVAGASCEGGAAVVGGGAGSGVHQRTSGNGSIGGGNQVNAPINAPVNVCGNAIAVVGGAVAGCEGGAGVVVPGCDDDSSSDCGIPVRYPDCDDSGIPVPICHGGGIPVPYPTCDDSIPVPTCHGGGIPVPYPTCDDSIPVPTCDDSSTPLPYPGGDDSSTPVRYPGGDDSSTPVRYPGGDDSSTPVRYRGGDDSSTPNGGDDSSTPTAYPGRESAAVAPAGALPSISGLPKLPEAPAMTDSNVPVNGLPTEDVPSQAPVQAVEDAMSQAPVQAAGDAGAPEGETAASQGPAMDAPAGLPAQALNAMPAGLATGLPVAPAGSAQQVSDETVPANDPVPGDQPVSGSMPVVGQLPAQGQGQAPVQPALPVNTGAVDSKAGQAGATVGRLQGKAQTAKDQVMTMKPMAASESLAGSSTGTTALVLLGGLLAGASAVLAFGRRVRTGRR